MKIKAPDSIAQDEPKYKANAWQQYELDELGAWVHLLCKRSKHRTDRQKREKDLRDASNYLGMMAAHVDHLLNELAESPEELGWGGPDLTDPNNQV